jgi:hypothetical protein
MKKLLALIALLLFATQAFAAEHITSFGSGSLGTNWVYDGTKYIGTNVYGTKVNFTDPSALAGKPLHYSITVTGMSQGTLRLRVGAPSAATPAGSDVFAVDHNGLAPIPDNFDTNAGLANAGVQWQDSSGDYVSAFRSRCGPDHYSNDDPIVFPGLPGRSHIHEFYGNTNTNAFSTERSLRLSGDSTCSSPGHPVYRSGFWAPAMEDGAGNIKVPIMVDVYYKQLGPWSSACGFPDATHLGYCNILPNGLRYVWGYNMANGHGGPGGVPQFTNTLQDQMNFECMTVNAETDKPGTGSYHSLTEMWNAGCRTPAMIFVRNSGPACWDGVRVDSTDHRSHVSQPSSTMAAVPVSYTHRNPDGSIIATVTGELHQPCPTDHPYLIPVPEIHTMYVADHAWDLGLWRYSCDEQMGMAMDRGTCLHSDYWEAWSPVVKQAWYDNCYALHMTCAGGELGNGKTFDLGGSIGMHNFSNPGQSQGSNISMTKLGFSRYITANGTYTGEITGIDGGALYFEGLDGFTGNVTAFSVTDQAKNTAYSTPITVHASLPVILSSLSDNFNDNVTDSSKWSVAQFLDGSTLEVTTTETGGTVHVLKDPSINGARYSGYVSTGTENLTGQTRYVSLLHTTMQTNEVVYLAIGPDANNAYYAYIESGTLYFFKRHGGSNAVVATIGSWSPTTHHTIALKESGGSVCLLTATSSASNPPLPGDFTSRSCETRDAAIPLTAAHEAFGAGQFGSGAVSPTTFIFDGFNTGT